MKEFAFLVSILAPISAVDWFEYHICNVKDEDQYLAYDLKKVSETEWDTGYLEPSDCEQYCNDQKDVLAPEKITCCIQARYYYSDYGAWAADCALVDSQSTETLEDTWDDAKGEYGTFQAFLMEPSIVTQAEIVLPTGDQELSVAFDANKGKPSDWKQNSKWKDTYYCDVEKITSYMDIAEPDKHWPGYLERDQCYSWCQENMEQAEAECCGQSWLFEEATKETQAYCALYQTSGFKNMPTEDTNDFTMFYTATIVNQLVVDEILGVGEEFQKYIESKVTNLDVSNTVVNVDMPEEFNENNFLSYASSLQSVSIFAALFLLQSSLI